MVGVGSGRVSGAEESVAAGWFLERDGRQDLAIGEVVAVGDDNQLVVVVIEPVDDADARALAVAERLIRAEQVGVEFFSVRGEGTRDVAVVRLIPKAVDGMGGAVGAVDG
jgi:hypothetical protein